MKNLFRFLIIIIFLVPQSTMAEQDSAIEKLEAIKRELSEKKKSIKKTERRERSILAIIDGLEKEIMELEQEEEELAAQHEAVKREVEEHRRELREIESRIKQGKQKLADRINALFKINQWGYLPVLFNADSLSNLMVQYKFLNILVKHDREIIEGLRMNFEKRRSHLEELEKKEAILKKGSEELKGKKENLVLKKDEKSAILKKIRDEKLLYHKAIRELEETTREIEKMLAEIKPVRESEDSEFVTMMGKLKMPVHGNIIKSFGKEIDPRFHTIVYRKGVVIKANENSEVRAIFRGMVAFAGTFSGYGNLIIIKHGGNYYSVYARLAELYKNEGDEVETGDIIGRIGSSGIFQEEGLYFELRKGGQPLDPEMWFTKN